MYSFVCYNRKSNIYILWTVKIENQFERVCPPFDVDVTHVFWSYTRLVKRNFCGVPDDDAQEVPKHFKDSGCSETNSLKLASEVRKNHAALTSWPCVVWCQRGAQGGRWILGKRQPTSEGSPEGGKHRVLIQVFMMNQCMIAPSLNPVWPETDSAGMCCRGSLFPRVRGQVLVYGGRGDRVSLWQDPGAHGAFYSSLNTKKKPNNLMAQVVNLAK